MRSGNRRARVVRFSSGRELTVFVGGGLLTTVLVGLVAAFLSHSIAHQQALADSARITDRLSRMVIGPLVPGYLARDRAGMAELDRVVADRMSDGSLMEVTIWSADGTVVYSDKAEDIGKTLPPSKQLLAAIAGRTTSCWEDDPPEADATSVAQALASTADDTGPRHFVEVYAPLRLEGRPPMVFEAYFNYRPVDDLAGGLLRQILPLVLIPLVLLQLIQIPVGLSLGRRLRRSENERIQLLQRDLSASDQERVRFATDLHDGPIQELAGGSYALGAVAATAADPQLRLVSRVQDAVQHSLQNLRGLMTDLDRSDLRSGRLDHTIAGLAEHFRAEGVDVKLELAELPNLSQEVMAALYRVVQGALANAHGHAAGQVTITLASVRSTRPGQPSRVRLVVTDDGVGLDPARIDRSSEGYLRMQLLHDRVTSLHGELLLTSAPGRGTTVRVDLPSQAGGHQEAAD
jgi:signal transduction histidine kinase